MRLTGLSGSIACVLAVALSSAGAAAAPAGSADIAVVLQPESPPACSALNALVQRPLKVSWGDYGAIASTEGLDGFLNSNHLRTRDQGLLESYEGRAKFRDSDLALRLEIHEARVELSIVTAQPACQWRGRIDHKSFK